MKQILLCILGMIVFSCQRNGKDEAKPSDCYPQRYYFKHSSSSDEYSYEYNSNNQLSKIFQLDRNSKVANKIILLTYNSNGQLIKVSDSLTYLQKIDRYYIFEYAGNNENPILITEYKTNNEKFDSWTVEYSNGRIIKTVPDGFFQHRYRRYAYDSNGNVVKIYYRDPIEKQEMLAMENSGFDDKKIFYIGSKALTLYNNLIAFRTPSQNNPGSTIYHYLSYGVKPSIPIIRNYVYQYNDKSFPVQVIYSEKYQDGNPVGGFTQQEEFFDYICK